MPACSSRTAVFFTGDLSPLNTGLRTAVAMTGSPHITPHASTPQPVDDRQDCPARRSTRSTEKPRSIRTAGHPVRRRPTISIFPRDQPLLQATVAVGLWHGRDLLGFACPAHPKMEQFDTVRVPVFSRCLGGNDLPDVGFIKNFKIKNNVI